LSIKAKRINRKGRQVRQLADCKDFKDHKNNNLTWRSLRLFAHFAVKNGLFSQPLFVTFRV